jgi:putative DNA primase/helicase
MHTNHKPVVRGTDEGIWRRLRLVPFDVVIPEDERDGKLPERLALEADGILTWMMPGTGSGGIADWPPEQVTTATQGFRCESDTVGLFLSERCRLDAGPHARVASADLFAAWVAWCLRENVKAGTQTAFGRDMTSRGFNKAKDGHCRMCWHGIDLYADEL